ncbi:MAG: NAD(P)H-hydrate dehydratase [Anaerolineales bacterium]|nr:NAD(P)H-hydrate dehydratase [Anaerolineales bacterium]
MFKIVTVSQMQAIERETDKAGISYNEMMENAGRGVAQALAECINVTGIKIVILVGPGNNGGDGLVAGRYLAESGAKVTFYLFRERSENDENYAQVLKMDLPIFMAADDPNTKILQGIIVSADVIVDALLGTGVDRPVRGAMRVILNQCDQAIRENRLNRRNSKLISPVRPSIETNSLPLVIAVDCPSGLNCDTGALDNTAIKADLTVTFDSPKLGHFIFPGASAVGDLMVADIGVPDNLAAGRDVELELATFEGVKDLLPTPALDAHKGTMGKVMVAAGSINYTGAAVLSGMGAYRAGAGLVTLAIPSAIHAVVAGRLPEATFVLLPHEMGAIIKNAARVLCDAIEGYDVLLVGPGLGQDEKTKLFLSALLTGEKQTVRGAIGFVHTDKVDDNQANTALLPPLVLDADALNILAGIENWPAMLPKQSILTPHPGEMARLMACNMETVRKDRVEIAKQAAQDWNQVIVLKGAYSVVAAPDGRAVIIPFANPALATAGSGDVLAGCIAALRAMGMDAYYAALAGAFIHGRAGQMAADAIGRTGVIAGDIALYIASVMADMLD